MKSRSAFRGFIGTLILFTAVHTAFCQGPPPLPTLRLLNLWRFYDTNLLGAFGAAPVAISNLLWVPSWEDGALQIDSPQPAWLRYREAETNGRPNLTLTNGSILFWFKPNWSGTNLGGSGPGNWARFVEVGTLTTNASTGWWSLYLDSPGTRLRLAAQANSNSAVFLECPVAFASNVWHHVTVTYSPSNSALYLDGQWMTNGAGITLLPGPAVRTNGFLVGSDSTGLAQMRGQMDRLQTFNEPLSAAAVANFASVHSPPGEQGAFIGGESGSGLGLVDEGAGLFVDGDLGGGQMSAMSSYAVTDLWLELSLTLTNTALVTVHNTGPQTNYLLLSATALGTSNWVAEQYFLGATGQTFTTLLVALSNRPSLFFAVGSSEDADGDGLPDAYERFVTGTDPLNPDTGDTGVPDGYQDGDGDGWSNMEEWRNGTNPNGWNAPPAPMGVWATYDSNNNRATITWERAPGTVVEYVVSRYRCSGPQVIAHINPATTSLVDENLADVFNPGMCLYHYQVQAVYANGGSQWSEPATFFRSELETQVVVVRQPQGQIALVFSALPESTAMIRLIRIDWNVFPTLEIPASRITNGVCVLSPSEVEFFDVYYVIGAQTVGSDGSSSSFAYLFRPELGYGPFVDGSTHLKQNLTLLLRAATRSYKCTFGRWDDSFPYQRPVTSTDYEHASYFLPNPGLPGHMQTDIYLPWYENWLFRNVAFSASDIDPSWDTWDTGDAIHYPDNLHSLFDPKYEFSLDNYSGDPNPLPAIIPPAAFPWNCYAPADSSTKSEIGLLSIAPDQYTLDSTAKNLFGLPFRSVKLGIGKATNYPVLVAGGTQTVLDGVTLFPETDVPVLETVGYFFTQATNVMPGHSLFTVTNGSPLQVIPFGQRASFAAWAKQRIVNGYTNKFAYLGQYFDKAHVADAYGYATTNEAGILSEYGEFFPTEPGVALLTTQPDLDQGGIQGTAVVHVIKLQLDVNHDGVMDLSFQGPDNTSAERPFRFWINNDYDRGHTVDITDWEEDDLEHDTCAADMTRYYTDAEYFGYVSGVAFPAIASMRDLEDYARLWLPGMSSLMAAMPTNYSVRLTLYGDAQIRLFRAIEANGGTNYLFDQTTASNQVTQSGPLYVGLLTSNSSITLSGQSNFTEHFLWCGARSGSATVYLQVLDENQTPIANTATYLQLQDIKEMYERWTVGDSGTVAPMTTARLAVEDLPPGTTAFQYGPPETINTPYILHVHGWNMQRWEKDRFGETMFKRLYWQGYQGRFGTFRWPTLAKFPATTGEGADLNHFDKSEFNAWQSGTELRKLLVGLDSKYPGQVRLSAHSMGNVVAGEALNTNTPLVAVYIAMQAALPSGAYWLGAPFRAIPTLYFDGTTELYRFYPVFTPSHPYFHFAAGAADCVNFYNQSDWALNLWLTDQNLKPADSLDYSFDISTNTFFQFQGTPTQRILTTPTNTFELFAFCVEGQCWALGAQTNVAGVFTTARQLDLDATFAFGNAHKGHSGQFRSTNMRRAAFWTTYATRMGVK